MVEPAEVPNIRGKLPGLKVEKLSPALTFGCPFRKVLGVTHTSGGPKEHPRGFGVSSEIHPLHSSDTFNPVKEAPRLMTEPTFAFPPGVVHGCHDGRPCDSK